MELSQWFTPGVLITLVSAIVGLIVKAVRLQTKVDELSKDSVERDKTIAAQGAMLESHRNNSDIHFNQRLAAEVEKGNEFRFKTIERQLGEINGKLDGLAKKV